MSWSPSSRDEQQALVDLFADTRRSFARSAEDEDERFELRVVCPGDFPTGPLAAKLAADMIYGLEHEEYSNLSSDEIVGRLARATKDERRRRVVEALALKEMKQAAFTANGLVAQVALGSQVMGPEARVELKAQAEDDSDWRDGMSYQGFLGDKAYQRALVEALPEAAGDLEAFLDTLKPETGLWCVYDAIRDVVQPSYYKAYTTEYLKTLQLEGDDVLERAAEQSGDPERYLEEIDNLRLRLPDDTYRLVDLLTPEMLMAERQSRWSSRSGPPSSLGEILYRLSEELDRRGWREARQASEALARKRKEEDPAYRALVDAEQKGRGRSAAEQVAASLAADEAPATFVLPQPPAIERERKEQKRPCLFGHDFQWREPRKEFGLWFVKEVCSHCGQERDYQIGSSSEDGHHWSAAGGSAPPPRKHWALHPHGHAKTRRQKAAGVLSDTLLLGFLAAIPLGLVAVVVIFFLGLSEGVKLSERPAIQGTLRPDAIAEASHGAWRWQGQHFLVFNWGSEPYDVEDSQWQYRWQRCTKGLCHDIPGATSASYTVRPQDAGKYLRVWVKIGPPPGKLAYKDVPAAVSKPRRVSR